MYNAHNNAHYVFFACAGQVMREDSCNQYVECDDCIGEGVGCVWCPDNPVSIVIMLLSISYNSPITLLQFKRSTLNNNNVVHLNCKSVI